MYEVQGEHRPGCRDVWVLTLAMLAGVVPVIIVLALRVLINRAERRT